MASRAAWNFAAVSEETGSDLIAANASDGNGVGHVVAVAVGVGVAVARCLVRFIATTASCERTASNIIADHEAMDRSRRIGVDARAALTRLA